tara:strand:- start:2254 stop:2925 length:672 start_codon:yes stop_codon:yes gene_type:complete
LSKNRNILFFGIGAVLGGTALILVLRKILVKYRAVSIAKSEWQGWGEPTIDINGNQIIDGGFESDKGFSERVGRYWKEGTGQNLVGSDREVPWSATFISWIMKKAGAGSKFVYNPSHSKYITDSIANRKSGNSKEPFVGYRINEIAPKVGDLVCYARQDGVGYDTTGSYKSHCDIVVSTKGNQIEVIGGNVNQAVTKKILKTDSKGLLMDTNRDWFTVIKNNI